MVVFNFLISFSKQKPVQSLLLKSNYYDQYFISISSRHYPFKNAHTPMPSATKKQTVAATSNAHFTCTTRRNARRMSSGESGA